MSPSSPVVPETLEAICRRLGDLPRERIVLDPAPGTATEADALRLADSDDKRICELIDGVLVEKAVGWHESWFAADLIIELGQFVRSRRLGAVTGEQGLLRLFPGLVLIPDVAFVSWGRMPGGLPPKEPIPDLAPDLVVEFLSPSNARREMERKRRHYFAAGVRLVWEIDHRTRTARVFTSPDDVVELDERGILDGGEVVPGFAYPLAKLFEALDPPGA